MDSKDTSKRKKDKQEEDDHYRDRRSKRPRSRTPYKRRDRESGRKRRHSKSRSPDTRVKYEKDKENEPTKEQETKKDIPERKAKDTDMLNTRTGGAYIPPARLRMMQAQITDKSSVAYQRLAWEALKKSIHGHINKINVGNIGIIIKELLKENIVRGRGLLCRSVIQAQAASPTFTNVYAALVSAVNSRFPNIGELLLKRLVIQFKRGFKRNDKQVCISSASFIAHLVNQRVAHEILALELLTLLVESPTDDSVEVAIAFLKESGQKLTEVSSKGVNAIFEMLRNILHEGQLDKRVQYMIEVMFQVWKDGFKDHPALIEELELVPEEEQFTHLLMLDDATDPQDILNVFKFDDKYEENEQKYKSLSNEILGSDAESGEEDGSEGSGSEESDDNEPSEEQKGGVTIIDNTETNLVALRRTIYLTINSSLDFEECAHKLMKMQLKPGQEVELCHMFLDCCAEQRTYEKFYGLLAQRFCNINRIYIGPFEEIFKDSYGTAHRLDTNRLRNVSKFFAHLLFTDSISWEVLECVKLNEEDTTSSSRIYIKILFQELAEYMGLKKLNDRLKDPTLQDAFSGIFPRDNPKNTRFSINFFTSIGLGGLTDELREHLKQMPKNVPAPVQEIHVDSESESSSSSSSDNSSDSSSNDSEDEAKKKEKKKKNKDKEKTPKTPPPESTDKDKNVERWGHSGFYDTYGKDARRYEGSGGRDRGRDNIASTRNDREKGRQVDRHYEERNKEREQNRYGQREIDERNSDGRRRNDDRNREESEHEARLSTRNRDDRQDKRQEKEIHRKHMEMSNEDRYSRQSDKEYRKEKSSGDVDEYQRSRSRPYKEDRKQNDREGNGKKSSGNHAEEHRYENRDDRRKVNDRDDSRSNNKSQKEGRKDKRRDHSSDDESRQEIQTQRKSKTDYTSSKKDDKKKKNVEKYSNDEDTNKKKRNEKDVRHDENISDSEDEDRNKKKKKSKKKSKHESSDEDDRRKTKHSDSDRVDEEKQRKNKSHKSKTDVADDDGWDIRGSSVRRDLGERYWARN